MLDKTKFYIDGQWVAPIDGTDFPVINPATEEAYATISLGGAKDAEVAIAAAKAAFSAWSFTTVETRIQYLEKLLAVYEDRMQGAALLEALKLLSGKSSQGGNVDAEANGG